MAITTWDGHLRIDHLPATGTVAITLLSVETSRDATPRAGLAVGFPTTDGYGPPTFVSVALRDGRVPEDVTALLGPRVSTAIADLLDGGRTGEWLQLDLVELDELAAAWAPYRAVVPVDDQPVTASSGLLGSLAGQLWTYLGLPSWQEALAELGPHRLAPTYRGMDDGPPADEQDASLPRGTLRLPDELAAATGVLPGVSWTMRETAAGTVEIDLRARMTGQPASAVLQAGPDDGSQRWVSFQARATGGLLARFEASGEPLNVRFRAEQEDRG
jgi:hypothetical protein